MRAIWSSAGAAPPAALAAMDGCAAFSALEIGRLRAALSSSGMELDPARHRAFFTELTPDPGLAR